MSTFSEIRNEETLAAALELCRGCYQRDLLNGHQALSGSTLRGTARNYGDRYRKSAASLMSRCTAAGLAVREERRKYGKRVIVVG